MHLLISNFVDRIQSIQALASERLCTLLVYVHLASLLAVNHRSKTAAKARLKKFDAQYLQGLTVVRAVQFLVKNAPSTSNFLLVVVVLVLQNQSSCRFEHFDSCHWPDLPVIVRNCF